MTEAERRAAVVAEPLSWEGTRYHPNGRIKVARDPDGNIIDRRGVDCAMLLLEVYQRAGRAAAHPVTHRGQAATAVRRDTL